MPETVIDSRTYDEIQIGEAAQVQRTLSERDIELFAAISGDLNPTHLHEDYAAASPLAGVVGHSMWGGTLVSGLLGSTLPGAGCVYREQDLRFHRPVRPGDTLTVTVTAREKRDAGHVVVFDCRGLNQHHELVFDGTAAVAAPTEKQPVPDVSRPEVSVRRHDAYGALLRRCAELAPVDTAVAHPCERTALVGAVEAAQAGLITPILVGPADRIRRVAEEAGIDLEPFRLVDVEHSHAAAARAVELVRGGEADVLMKGSLHTDELLGAVVPSATGLRTARRISHAFVMSVPTYPKPLIVTDAAINIFPGLEEKQHICQNAIDAARTLGVDEPRVAVLSAVETVTAKIPSTLDAAALCKMADRGQITGGLIDGPLAMDNAISVEAARTKGIESPVAGNADILLAPDLEAGNILAKQLTFLANADAAGIVLGARVPIILTSRADTVRTRLASCGVAVLLADARRSGRAGAAR